jgi:hypothetical protein
MNCIKVDRRGRNKNRIKVTWDKPAVAGIDVDIRGDVSVLVVTLPKCSLSVKTSSADLVNLARKILEAAATPGVCHMCLCTEHDPCFDESEEGQGLPCAWANKARTLCTVCARRLKERK